MKKQVLYVVPDVTKKNSGPAVRVSNIIKSDLFDTVIVGGFFSKVQKMLRCNAKSLIYVESATNRLNLVDIFCLLFLKFVKRGDVRVYIRDCYTILFPEEYLTARKRITKYLLDLTNRFYIFLSSKLYFPTKEMSKVFSEYYDTNKLTSDLPPGVVSSEFESFTYPKSIASASVTLQYVLHVGGLSYKYSGVDELISFSASLPEGFKLLLITRDIQIFSANPQFSRVRDKVEFLSLNRDGVIERIKKGDVIAAVHTRPLNRYDDITFPIKILDYISWKLPILTLKHKPVVNLLGEDYPFYLDEIDSRVSSILSLCCDNPALPIIYGKINREHSYAYIFEGEFKSC